MKICIACSKKSKDNVNFCYNCGEGFKDTAFAKKFKLFETTSKDHDLIRTTVWQNPALSLGTAAILVAGFKEVGCDPVYYTFLSLLFIGVIMINLLLMYAQLNQWLFFKLSGNNLNNLRNDLRSVYPELSTIKIPYKLPATFLLTLIPLIILIIAVIGLGYLWDKPQVGFGLAVLFLFFYLFFCWFFKSHADRK